MVDGPSTTLVGEGDCLAELSSFSKCFLIGVVTEVVPLSLSILSSSLPSSSLDLVASKAFVCDCSWTVFVDGTCPSSFSSSESKYTSSTITFADWIAALFFENAPATEDNELPLATT